MRLRFLQEKSLILLAIIKIAAPKIAKSAPVWQRNARENAMPIEHALPIASFLELIEEDSNHKIKPIKENTNPAILPHTYTAFVRKNGCKTMLKDAKASISLVLFALINFLLRQTRSGPSRLFKKIILK